ncbi:unnamed protein product, partial [Ectocarpus sp. 12 AP-2014]
MVATRERLRPSGTRSRVTAGSGSSSDGEGSSATTWNSDTASAASSFSRERAGGQDSSSSLKGGGGDISEGSSTGPNSVVMTRKRRLLQETEARIAVGVVPYWEGGVDLGGDIDQEKKGTPRR